MREKIEKFLDQRSPREIFLCKACFLLLCIFIAWRSGMEQICERYFDYSILEESPQPLPFLDYFQSQELITRSSILINFSQSDISQEYFTLKTQGKIQDFFSLLNILKSYPSLKITAFFLDSKGEFSLTLYGENAQTYALPSAILPHSFTLSTPWKKPILTSSALRLEAVLNQKAKINGQWVGIGESIAGYTLKSIQKDSITLQNPTHTLTLHLRERIFK